MGNMPVQELKALAKRCRKPRHLHCVHTSTVLENPLCGDEVLLELEISGDTVSAVGYSVHGCLLCTAATALLVDIIPGMNNKAIQAINHNLEMVLQGKESSSIQEALQLFKSAKEYPSRHECVMLPFRAAVKALQSYHV